MKLAHSAAFCILTIALSSCVSQKKYNDLLGGKARSDREVARLTQVEKEHQALKVEMAETKAMLMQTEDELAQLKEKYRTLEAEHAQLKSEYEILLTNNKNLLASASDEKKELTTQLSAKQRELDEKARMLNALREELDAKEAALAEREENINFLNAQLDAQKQKLQALKAGLNDALRGFSAADLTVEERNGKIYVSMSQNLLFASGSNKIDQKGKDALAKLSSVLANSTDIDILVEGHTDTDGTADFNWDLSVSRATSVVKELTSHGVDAKRITAAGRSFFVPIASNETADGKSKNRRTEIILSPKFEQLYQLLN